MITPILQIVRNLTNFSHDKKRTLFQITRNTSTWFLNPTFSKKSRNDLILANLLPKLLQEELIPDSHHTHVESQDSSDHLWMCVGITMSYECNDIHTRKNSKKASSKWTWQLGMIMRMFNDRNPDDFWSWTRVRSVKTDRARELSTWLWLWFTWTSINDCPVRVLAMIWIKRASLSRKHYYWDKPTFTLNPLSFLL